MELEQTTFGGFSSPAPFTREFLSEPTITMPRIISRAPSQVASPVPARFDVNTATNRDILIELWNQIHLIQADLLDLTNKVDDERQSRL